MVKAVFDHHWLLVITKKLKYFLGSLFKRPQCLIIMATHSQIIIFDSISFSFFTSNSKSFLPSIPIPTMNVEAWYWVPSLPRFPVQEINGQPVQSPLKLFQQLFQLVHKVSVGEEDDGIGELGQVNQNLSFVISFIHDFRSSFLPDFDSC